MVPFSLHKTNNSSATKSRRLTLGVVSKRHNLLRNVFPCSGLLITSFNGGKICCRTSQRNFATDLDPFNKTINAGEICSYSGF